MEWVRTIDEVRARRARWAAAGEALALVPTMGNLHAGHLRLVERARELAPRVAVSIFVNPLQFAPGEDLERYPRTPEDDRRALAAAGVDLVFVPEETELYPRGRAAATRVRVPELGDILCGAFRPGHFEGVATVVLKLFNIFQPDWAVFGKKDYQQLCLIRRLVEDLDLTVRIAAVDTVREPDGLAMSSRNRYLGSEERARAGALYATLRALGERLRAGEDDYAAVEAEGLERLRAAGLRPEYVAVRAPDLAPPAPGAPRLVVLAAAHLGAARLIDNLEIERPAGL
ncbi:MAG: pantothenate synthetase [Gammaproteobacteria bacterium]|nr:MAG: pantothenate synthetase [Gammaproteobacteria bacterium]